MEMDWTCKALYLLCRDGRVVRAELSLSICDVSKLFLLVCCARMGKTRVNVPENRRLLVIQLV